ncbi:MAG: J domain-containing protein [Treponema sp.]|nr:J domain-containing protein [Treponema sp.]
MGIWERLGKVLKSYIDEGVDSLGSKTGRGSPFKSSSSDPDLDAAYRELNDYLEGDPLQDPGEPEKAPRPIPRELHQDLAELGLGPSATAEDCKEAYKKLLHIHHPDRHANHEGNLKKATEKSARVNTAYDRLERWFKANPSG